MVEEALRDPRNNKSMLGDYNGETKRVAVDENGQLLIGASDIQIGAVEIKDGTTDNRVVVNDDGSLKVDVGGGNVTSATNTKVSVGSSSTTVLALNTSRVAAILVNDSDEVIYISLSGTAVINEGIRLNAYGGNLIETEYTGIITAICASGTKNLTVVEK